MRRWSWPEIIGHYDDRFDALARVSRLAPPH
jgi:hypothetical protein